MLSTFLQFTQVGKISEICDDKDKDQNGNPMYARVLPLNADGVVSLPLIIEPHLRGEFGDLKVNDLVWYATGDDGTGVITGRADGTWTGEIPGDLKLVVGKKNNTCNVDSERGYLELHEGNFKMDKGDAEIVEGNAKMDNGNAEIVKGNATLDNGDLTLLQGGITVENGNVTIHGNLIIQGDITLTGNMTATGNINASGNMVASGSMTAASMVSQGEITAASVNASGNVAAASVNAGTVTASGNIVAADVTAGAVTLATHTHTVVSVGSPTSTPIG